MQISQVVDSATLHDLFQFRHSVFVDELYWQDGVEGILKDQFDEKAHNFAAFDDDGKIVGSIRVVCDTTSTLPLERFVSLDEFRIGKVMVEFNRLAVAQHLRQCSKVSLHLMAAAYQCALKLKATHMLIDSYHCLANLYKKLGFKSIAPPYYDPNFRCELPVLAMACPLSHIPTWRHSRVGLYRLFTANEI